MAGKWSEAEIKLLSEWYPLEGNACYTRFEGRTKASVKAKASKLGIKFTDSAKWTKNELKILREFYPLEGSECYTRFKARNKGAVKTKAAKLNITTNNRRNTVNHWAQEELDILKEWYPIDTEECYNRLNSRTKVAIQLKASVLKVPHQSSWAREELDILKEWYPINTEECHSRLNKRTKAAIQMKASDLGILHQSNWAQKEIDILKEWYPTDTEECYNRLNKRTKDAVQRKASVMGIPHQSKWIQEELDIVKEWYPIDTEECYSRLNKRTKATIQRKASDIGITCLPKYNNERYDKFIAGRHFIRLGEYTGSMKKLAHNCSICGHTWDAIASNILYNRTGCPACSSNFKDSQIIFLYLIRIETETEKFLKVGLTGDLNRRIKTLRSGSKASKVSRIYIIEGKAEVLVPIEHEILRKSNLIQHMPEIAFDGQTECLDIDEESKVLELMQQAEKTFDSEQ